MWYQGINHAPPIFKLCINSIINNRVNHTVYILTKYHLDKYIKLPTIIESKFIKGYIMIAHLSDIIRMGILYKYGGYWIDSTFFITKPISSINSTFYTLKLNHCFIYCRPFVGCLCISEFKIKIEELRFIKCDIFSLFESLNLNYDNSLFICPFNKLNKRVKENILHNQTFTNYRYIIKTII